MINYIFCVNISKISIPSIRSCIKLRLNINTIIINLGALKSLKTKLNLHFIKPFYRDYIVH